MSFRRVVFSTFFNCLIFFYTVLLYLRFFWVFSCWYILYIFLIPITYFVIFVSIAQYFAQNKQQWTYTSQKENTSEKQINWKECHCHSTGQTSDLSKKIWGDSFKKAAEIRNDLAHNLLKHCWSAGPRGGYHRRCYLTCTSKRNLKGKMDDNVKVPVTNNPAKLPRTYGSSKCVICLEDK